MPPYGDHDDEADDDGSDGDGAYCILTNRYRLASHQGSSPYKAWPRVAEAFDKDLKTFAD